MQKLSALFSALICVVLLSACAEFPGVYKVDVEQGNILTKEAVAKLAVGQTKEQVQFVLGTALIKDTFVADRWDYAYRIKHEDGFTENANLVLYFEDGLLSQFDAQGVTKEK